MRELGEILAGVQRGSISCWNTDGINDISVLSLHHMRLASLISQSVQICLEVNHNCYTASDWTTSINVRTGWEESFLGRDTFKLYHMKYFTWRNKIEKQWISTCFFQRSQYSFNWSKVSNRKTIKWVISVKVEKIQMLFLNFLTVIKKSCAIAQCGLD